MDADDYTNDPAYLDRRKKQLKKLLTQQKSATNDAQAKLLLSSDHYALAEPEKLIWWVRKEPRRQPAENTAATARNTSSANKSAQSQQGISTSAAKSNHTEDEEDDSEWLLGSLEVLLVTEGSTEPATDVEVRVRRIIESSSSDDVARDELLELLGFSDVALELIPKIIERRARLKRRRSDKRQGASTASASKKVGSGIGRDAGTEKVFIKGAKVGGGFLNESAKKSLPAGTTRAWLELRKIDAPDTVTARYERVWVPAPPRPPPSTSELDAIPISRFGTLSQKAFAGIPSLNRLQSRLFHAAYETSENLLVCAPTGAGKTNVAMTAIAREIDKSQNPRSVKVVYVAPMKALAQEVVEKFSERLAPLKMQVKELTGDTQLSRGDIEKTQVVVTTPEKWDVITRKAGGDGTLGELVQLLIIDEVHLVGEDRGPVIEALVARTIRQVERRQQMVRIVGLSATLPNYIDVALFLRVNPERGMFFFDSSFRPVPLEQTFVGVALPTSVQQQQQQQQHLDLAAALSGQTPKDGSATEDKQRQQKSQIKTQRVMEQAYNEIACQYTLESIEKGNQVMVFVHTRKDTSKTARALLDIAELKFHNQQAFGPKARNAVPQHNAFSFRVSKSKNQELQYLFARGMGIHHAGMAREDRSLTEEMFTKGAISVLCCTATLAWGVNLPAHTVIVKGTQIYAPERGGICELNSADVFQCFGRAGRPQFDTSGEAILITEHAQLARYLAMLNHALPLESKLVPSLPDALNAEIVSGTVSSLDEASAWLSYTFLYIRMLKSPISYGVSFEERENDPHLETQRMKLVGGAAKRLSEARMIRIGIVPSTRQVTIGGFVPSTPLGVTDLGRVASHYYVHHETVESMFNETLRPIMTYQELFEAICSSKEFDQLKLRDEEIVEVKRLVVKACPFEPFDSLDATAQTTKSKAFVLFQTYISRFPVDAFTLHSDMNYISQNAARISRALFEVALARGWLHLAMMTLKVCAALERRAWWWPMQHPLRQVAPVHVSLEAVACVEMNSKPPPEDFSLANLLRETPESLANKVLPLGIQRATKVISASKLLPRCQLVLVHRQPITSGLLRLVVRLVPSFTWKDRVHFENQSYYLFVDDGDWVLHSERISLSKERCQRSNQANDEEPIELTFTVPLFQLQQHQGSNSSGSTKYYVRIESDSGWLDVGDELEIDLLGLEVPKESGTFYTDLLHLEPVSILALQNPRIQETLAFSHFNPVQTQCFHVLYHRDESCIIGAPTGSGKTTLAELAMWRVLFETNAPSSVGTMKPLVVYVAPMKALVSERIQDWRKKFVRWNKRVCELTGDSSPSAQELRTCDLIVATPEKFEIVTRFWAQDEEHFLRRVRLVVLDEIHLLGEERGASLEMLISRLKDCSRQRTLQRPIRLVGLSTALANARDLGEWFKDRRQGQGMNKVFVYNFRPAVRVVPLEVHVSGFPGMHYCPRMASMNKPVFHAIERYSKEKPVLIFVASRRQTRLTAFDLISLCASSDDPRRFLKMDLTLREDQVEDDALRHSLQFGIALHHAGLSKSDRELSERCFSSGACQVLIATATLAWGVNLPAHLVIIKGTEYFDASKRRYEPFPVTDVLQMMGRAGRPQFGDEKGIAVILVHDQLKAFYKRFLYEPFPVESNLISSGRLDSFINAEICAGRMLMRVPSFGEEKGQSNVSSFLQDSYLAVRVRQNPSFYGCKSSSTEDVNFFFRNLADKSIQVLLDAGCLQGLSDSTHDTERELAEDQEEEDKDEDIADSFDRKVSLGVKQTASKKTAVRVKQNQQGPLEPTPLGMIAARFDLKPKTAHSLMMAVSKNSEFADDDDGNVEKWILETVAQTSEFQDIPVRHKEDELNLVLADGVRFGLGTFGKSQQDLHTPHCKAFLLLQSRTEPNKRFVRLPIHDYITDAKQVVDIASRVLPAMVEVACLCQASAKIAIQASKLIARLSLLPVRAVDDEESGEDSDKEEEELRSGLAREQNVQSTTTSKSQKKGAATSSASLAANEPQTILAIQSVIRKQNNQVQCILTTSPRKVASSSDRFWLLILVRKDGGAERAIEGKEGFPTVSQTKSVYRLVKIEKFSLGTTSPTISLNIQLNEKQSESILTSVAVVCESNPNFKPVFKDVTTA